MTALRWPRPAARVRATQTFVAALLLVGLAVSRWDGGAAAQPVDSLDWRAAPNALELDLVASAPDGGAVTFQWFVRSQAPVTCRLDADGDGTFEHEIRACEARKELEHRYTRSGIDFATMDARAADGPTGLAQARIVVAAPER